MRRALVCLLIATPAILALLAVAAGGQTDPYPPTTQPGDGAGQPSPSPSTVPAAAGGAGPAAPAAGRGAGPAQAGGDGLALTGGETWLLVAIAIGALALGTALVVGTRRRAATRAGLLDQ
jgi:hypothetical protein